MSEFFCFLIMNRYFSKFAVLGLAVVGGGAVAFAEAVHSSYVPEPDEIAFRVVQTRLVEREGKVVPEDPARQDVRSTPFTPHAYADIPTIDLDAAEPRQEMLGFGVSLTDASAWLLSELRPDRREKLLRHLFGPAGIGLSIVRLNVGSSDYATALYNYNDAAGDVRMELFSVARDDRYLIPMFKEIRAVRPDLYTFASTWSCPGWMKTSGAMCGGALRDDCLPAFANYLVAYLKAYRRRGVTVDALTVNNEPDTDQDGGCPACLISGKQEAELAGRLLPSRLKAAGLSTDIWILDHNYDLWERVLGQLRDPEVRANVAAVAWHPYAGKPEMIEKVRAEFPDVVFHMTENGPSLARWDRRDAFWWSRNIFDALNHGCSSYCGWNLCLDQDGQPNAGHFACGGFVELDSRQLDKTAFKASAQCVAIGHVAPYVKRGAHLLATGAWSKDGDVVGAAFRNPDGTLVLVCAASHTEKTNRRSVQVKCRGQYLALRLPVRAGSLTTVIIPPEPKPEEEGLTPKPGL